MNTDPQNLELLKAAVYVLVALPVLAGAAFAAMRRVLA